MYAIIATGGKQYKVQAGDVILIEKLDAPEGEVVQFSDVLAVSGNQGLIIGSPYVVGASVSAKVEKNGKLKKITVFKYKPKKNYRKKQGHRQPYTRVIIETINQEADQSPKAATKKAKVSTEKVEA